MNNDEQLKTAASVAVFKQEVESIRTEIFYWMTRNHNRGEQSYAMLGEIKERLTEALRL